ncbi:hypothetical protein M1D46_15835 [Microbacterium sp. JZ70]
MDRARERGIGRLIAEVLRADPSIDSGVVKGLDEEGDVENAGVQGGPAQTTSRRGLIRALVVGVLDVHAPDAVAEDVHRIAVCS